MVISLLLPHREQGSKSSKTRRPTEASRMKLHKLSCLRQKRHSQHSKKATLSKGQRLGLSNLDRQLSKLLLKPKVSLHPNTVLIKKSLQLLLLQYLLSVNLVRALLLQCRVSPQLEEAFQLLPRKRHPNQFCRHSHRKLTHRHLATRLLQVISQLLESQINQPFLRRLNR